MFYREDTTGQMLQEGINEPGAMASWIAAATSYSTSDTPMIPFYIYYSMFGFQRVGDLAWAAGDIRARGFLLGGAGARTDRGPHLSTPSRPAHMERRQMIRWVGNAGTVFVRELDHRLLSVNFL